MGLRQCDKCSEMVDEAKAFCPNCGHAFVEEQTRTEPSDFESMDGTMQLGNTMYNQMLSDMGLNISAAPDKLAEVVMQPAAQPVVQQPVSQPPLHQVIQPAVQQVIQPAVQPAKPSRSSKTKWFIIGGIAILLLFIAAIVILLAAAIIWKQYS